RLIMKLHFDENRKWLLRRRAELFDQIDSIYGFNAIENLSHLLCLIGLDVPNEMPVELQVNQVVHFRERILQPVFANVTYATRGGLTNTIRRDGLGDGNERNGLGISVGTHRRVVNLLLDPFAVLDDSHTLQSSGSPVYS